MYYYPKRIVGYKCHAKNNRIDVKTTQMSTSHVAVINSFVGEAGNTKKRTNLYNIVSSFSDHEILSNKSPYYFFHYISGYEITATFFLFKYSNLKESDSCFPLSILRH